MTTTTTQPADSAVDLQKRVFKELAYQLPGAIIATIEALAEEDPNLNKGLAFQFATIAAAGGTSVAMLKCEVNGHLKAVGRPEVFGADDIRHAQAVEIARLVREKVAKGLDIPDIKAILERRWPDATPEQLGEGILLAKQGLVDEAAEYYAVADTLDEIYGIAEAKAGGSLVPPSLNAAFEHAADIARREASAGQKEPK